MNRRLLVGMLAVALAGGLLAANAPAAILPGTWIMNTVNTYEDQDRDAFFDMDASGGVTVGDVILAYERVDNRKVPSGPPPTATPGLNVMVSQIVKSITAAPNAAGTRKDYVMELTGTPASHPLSLSSLLSGWGKPLPALQPGTPIAAVYEGIPFDSLDLALVPTGAGGMGAPDFAHPYHTIVDIMEAICRTGTLDLVLGEGAGLTEADDYWVSLSDGLSSGEDVNASLAVLNLLNSISDVGATFTSGMSALGGPLEGALLEKVPNPVVSAGQNFDTAAAPNPPAPPFVLYPDGIWRIPSTDHEFVVSAGDLNGANDLLWPGGHPSAGANPFFGNAGMVGHPVHGIIPGIGSAMTLPAWGGGGGFDPFPGGAVEFFGASTNADKSLYPIPEPTTVVIWSLLGLVAGVTAWRRRRAR